MAIHSNPVNMYSEGQVNWVSLGVWVDSHEGAPLHGSSILLPKVFSCRGWQEEPAILISRVLSQMRHMYVASTCLDFH